MTDKEIWLLCFASLLQAADATRSYPAAADASRSYPAEWAAYVADSALEEYQKRWNPGYDVNGS